MASGFLRLRQPRELLAVAQQSIPSNGSPSVTRDTPPTNTTTSTPGCVMWIHLQTSISTEWQQSSMVKRPQTIHRCILQNQRSSTETPINITCHVCGGDYETYQIYLQHLFDGTSCGQKKKSTPSKLSPPLVTMTTTSNPLPSTSALKNRELSMNHLYSWTNLCPHFAAATQTRPIPLDDFLYDQATLATLKIELASLIAGIIGEDKLTSLGYPDTDILSIAQTLLQMTQGSCRRVEEGCSGACVRLESVLNTTQLKYQKLKTQLAVGRLNTMRLLEICLPNQRIWSEKKWLEKPMEVILGEIIHEAAHGNVNNLNPSSSVIILD